MMKTTDDLTSLFLELIAIDGVSGNEKPVADYIVRFLTGLGFSPFTDDAAAITGSNTGNVICPINGGGDFVLLCHMDTARPTLGVKPVFHEDRITSDGTTVLGVDDRAGISALLYALKKAVTENIPLRPFTLAFTTCEETTLLGSQSLKLDPAIQSGFVFDSYLPTGTFVNESCGAVALNIIIHGKASHSGIAPEKGINAIQIAVEALAKFPFGRINADTTANIGLIKGGTATNVVPDFVQLEGEIRSKDVNIVDRTAREVERYFHETAAKYGGTAEVGIIWDFRPYIISPESREYQRLVQVMTSLGLEAKAAMSWGGSDANSLNAKGIRTINLGTGAQNPHSNEECILYEDLENSAKIAMQLIMDDSIDN
ncbi:MAG: M20/M25/M40 family metallo-hydrolase [Tannerella sp.]|jgi:tripeptide aminopeptidase|nr:M20/M25/M40 family metallo-hydrolase [Tannerella sp.]